MFYTMFSGGDPTSLIEVGVEKAVGQIKIGSNVYTVYQQIVSLGALPNNQVGVNYSHNINYVGVLSVTGYAWSGTTWFNFPRTTPSGLIDIYIQPNVFKITATLNVSSYSANAIVTYYR